MLFCIHGDMITHQVTRVTRHIPEARPSDAHIDDININTTLQTDCAETMCTRKEYSPESASQTAYGVDYLIDLRGQ